MRLTITIDSVDGNWTQIVERLRKLAHVIAQTGDVEKSVGMWSGKAGTVVAAVELSDATLGKC